MGVYKIDRAKAYMMYEHGCTKAEITKEIGCTVKYLEELLRKKYGSNVGRKIDTGKIRALWEAGWSINKIMADMELTEQQVREVLFNEQI